MIESSRLISASDTSVRELRTDVRPPQLYDFRDWQLFKTNVLLYHSIVSPEKNQLNERIAMFRTFMTPRVDTYLKSKYPVIFEHGEFETWTDWVDGVTQLLRRKDPTIIDPSEIPVGDSESSWAERYQSGTITEKELWIELSELANQGVISTDIQISMFWESHSALQQSQLCHSCPYFDPNNEVWDKSAPCTDGIIAQRLLNDVVQSDIHHYERKYRTVVIALGVASFVLACAGAVLLGIQEIPTLSSYYDRVAYFVCAVIGLLCFAVLLPLLIVLFVYLHRWRKMIRVQRAYHLGVPP